MSLRAPKKILILRFSSIGDIVLTFPVVQALKVAYPDCQIDYVTKKSYRSLLDACVGLNQVFILESSLGSLKQQIDFRSYDAVLDLHHNLRTQLLTAFTGAKTFRFPKNNWQKWLLTRCKIKPGQRVHVVERYLQTLQAAFSLEITAPEANYLVPVQEQFSIEDRIGIQPKKYIAVAIGAQFATKRLPTDLLIELINKLHAPVVLLGGKEDEVVAQQIISALAQKQIVSMAGQLSIHASAWVVKNAATLLTHDTGLMHIGAAFEVPIHLIWGNTTRDFGMYPLRLEQENCFQYEVPDLTCRPCSKIGHQSCPKGHFACMRNQDLSLIAKQLNATEF
ncbi:MAG: glycosyltransferase family 9 protein [Flavobacteriales bacterium]